MPTEGTVEASLARSAPYAAARTGAAWFALADRDLLAVTGPLRQKFLHGVLSNDVLALAAGQGRRAALMDVKGRLLAFLRVLVAGDAVYLEVAGGKLTEVQALLEHYRVAAPVKIAHRPSAVFAVVGPEALRALGLDDAGLLAAEDHSEATLGGRPVRVARAGDLPAAGFVVYAAAEDAEAVRAALAAAGATPLDAATMDALRIEDGRPWYGADVTDENLLHETGLLQQYHSFTKGCYVGQEVVARLEGRGGHVNKSLRGLRLGAPAAAGDAIEADGREVGRITTAGVSPSLGPVAMAYVHRSRAEPGSVVTVGGVEARVEALPLLAVATER